MRRSFTIQERINLLGFVLLVGGIAGLYFDSIAAPPPVRLQPPRPQGTLLAVVTPTALPTLAPTQPVEITPTLPQGSTHLPTAADGSEASFLAPVSLEATATPEGPPMVPDRLVIPSIQLDAPVVPAAYQLVEIDSQVFQQWEAPAEPAAGWQFASAGLGRSGNTVLNGHHNIHGSVFARLVDIHPGDTIGVHSGSEVFTYTVTEKMILPEKDQPLEVRVENAHWLEPTDDERLTLITCWPDWSNTHRLIIVARR